MYVSPAVRSIREHPIDGESVTLLVTAAADTDAVAEALREHGSIEAELEFETLAVEVPHEAVEAVCAIEGIESIETADTLAIDPDGAGEDVRPDG